MPDRVFTDPRLARIYDALDPDRSDLALYVELASSVKARRVLDLGCGTGTLALLLAGRGLDVTAAWDITLHGLSAALRPGVLLAFETRDPAGRAWEDWNRHDSYRVSEIGEVGSVESWVEVTEVDGALVSFRWTFRFASDGAVLISDSTLRFRERDEVQQSLIAHGYRDIRVRDAPDRPGRELVFLASR